MCACRLPDRWLPGRSGRLRLGSRNLPRGLTGTLTGGGHLPDRSGAEACRELKLKGSPTKVLFLTSYGDEANVLAGLTAGADGYLLKTITDGDIADSVLKVAAGGAVLDPLVLGYTPGIGEVRRPAVDARAAGTVRCEGTPDPRMRACRAIQQGNRHGNGPFGEDRAQPVDIDLRALGRQDPGCGSHCLRAPASVAVVRRQPCGPLPIASARGRP